MLDIHDVNMQYKHAKSSTILPLITNVHITSKTRIDGQFTIIELE